MRARVSSGMRVIRLLGGMGICAESALVMLNGRLVPETSITRKGDVADIIFYKHVPPLLASQDAADHWKKACMAKAAGGRARCTMCETQSSVYLPAFCEHLCEAHFIESFERRAKRSIGGHKMIRRGSRIGIGLSGGKDSFALLHVLAGLRKSLPFELVAVSIDEGIPGYRDKAIGNAKEICEELGIEQHVYSFRKEYGTTVSAIARKGKGNLCSYCGVLRRRLLNSKARELGLDAVAIAHNLDDVAQTAMLNIIRNEPMRFARMEHHAGEARAGVYAGPAARGMVPRISPLRDIREKEVAAYALLKGHRFGRKCCCPHSKDAMRWSVRHELNRLEERYPGTKIKIAACAGTVQKLAADALSKKGFSAKACMECGEPSSAGLCMACRMLGEL